MNTNKIINLLGMLLFSVSANASLSINDIDLNNLSFEVDNLNSSTLVTGTSNGIGYTLSTGGFSIPHSNIIEMQPYNDLPNNYDDLHLSKDFTITFDQEIDFLLVALANDNNTGDGPNFGFYPSDTVDVFVSGSQISITDIGGALVLYDFTSPITSITHTNTNVLDGFDVSFFAGVSPVPEPSSYALMLGGLGMIGFMANRRRKKANA